MKSARHKKQVTDIDKQPAIFSRRPTKDSECDDIDEVGSSYFGILKVLHSSGLSVAKEHNVLVN